jgi:hypothetical protein
MSRSAAFGWMFSIVAAAGCASGGKTATAQIKPVEVDEPALMDKIRNGDQSDPTAAFALTEEGERRFGDSAFAEERRAAAVQALIELNRIGAARSRAYQFLERYPNGPYSAHVAAMTGVHLTPKRPAAHPSP